VRREHKLRIRQSLGRSWAKSRDASPLAVFGYKSPNAARSGLSPRDLGLKLGTFAYKARNNTGESVNGTLVADNQIAAARMLEERRLLPVELSEVSHQSKSVLTGRAKRVSPAKVGVVYEQLADLLNAGVPLLRSLQVLGKQAGSPALARVIEEVREDVAGGDSLAEAMSKHPQAFNPLHVSMIKAGEKGGFLEEVLSRLSDFVVRADELKNKFIGALMYPAILLTVLLGAVGIIMGWVVPRIRPMIEGQTLPLPTRIVFGITDFVGAYYTGIGGVLLIVIVALIAFMQSERGKHVYALLQLRMWGTGPIFTMVALCRFCRILGTLLHNGIPIITSLEIAKDSAGNPILADAIHRAADNVRHGEDLTAPLAASKLFPPAILDMIAVAEESNTLDKTLIEVANTQEARTGRQIDLFMRMLEPLLLLLAAVLVGFIAVALLLPILSMASSGLSGG
jgi:general secretion pathway protein F